MSEFPETIMLTRESYDQLVKNTFDLQIMQNDWQRAVREAVEVVAGPHPGFGDEVSEARDEWYGKKYEIEKSLRMAAVSK